MAVETKIVDRGWLGIQKELGLASKMSVAVGVLAADANRPTKDGATLGEVATWNHFGTSRSPARPFIVRPIDMRKTEVSALIKRLVAGVTTGKLGTEQALGLLGQKLQGICVQSINAREYEPNAESTIKAKGSDQPLVDTGQLKSSISYEVR